MDMKCRNVLNGGGANTQFFTVYKYNTFEYVDLHNGLKLLTPLL